ncbi:BASS family bile acid:Na+ symporter [Novosphingobium sp. PhB165]|uniref:Na+-dependent transporter n=1 Tax=Novosphingobium sp. PhB165 TaxID=2485105 RepID=UPI00104EF587|nr:Na+-dependent transporter [Novosphingobium sp. PhB165]TCM20448.1 BASS family bile acid:Na+ symporter [Novosphingobium sp. PhB165]
MEFVKHLLPLLLTGSLALMIIAAGIASSRGDFAYVLARPALLGRAMVAIVVIPVLIAVVIIALCPISHSAKAGIFLMAISPVAPLMPGKALKFGGHGAYVYGLQAAGAVLALLFVPTLGELGSKFYDVDAHFPIGVVARNIFVGLVIPLGIGLVLGRLVLRKVSPALPRTLMIIANLLLILAFLPILASLLPDIGALIGDGTILAMAVVVGTALIGGHLLGGPDPANRATLAFSASMRHPGIALALAGANHADKAITAAVLLFLLVGLVVLIPYQVALKRKAAPA